MVGLVFPMATHGGRKTREKGEISKIKLLQSKNKLRAFVEEEERNSMEVAEILKGVGRKRYGDRKCMVVVTKKEERRRRKSRTTEEEENME